MLLKKQRQKKPIWSHWIFDNDTSKSKISSFLRRISNCQVALLQHLRSSLSLIALSSIFLLLFLSVRVLIIWTVAFSPCVYSSQSLAGRHTEISTDEQCPSISSTGNQANSFLGAVQWNIYPDNVFLKQVANAHRLIQLYY